MNRPMHVRYFDLGMHKGGEIKRMRRYLRDEPLATSWEMIGFEAHPGLARRCRWRFVFDRSIRVEQVALGSSEGTCTLYLNRNLVGSSIYAGKNNVIRGKEIEVAARAHERGATRGEIRAAEKAHRRGATKGEVRAAGKVYSAGGTRGEIRAAEKAHRRGATKEEVRAAGKARQKGATDKQIRRAAEKKRKKGDDK